MPTKEDYGGNCFRKAVPDLPVKYCEAALRYYLDVLGFKKDFDDRALGRAHVMFAGVSRGECALTLDQHGFESRSPGLTSCDIDDVDLLYEEYMARGVKVNTPPEDTPWGNATCRFEMRTAMS